MIKAEAKIEKFDHEIAETELIQNYTSVSGEQENWKPKAFGLSDVEKRICSFYAQPIKNARAVVKQQVYSIMLALRTYRAVADFETGLGHWVWDHRWHDVVRLGVTGVPHFGVPKKTSNTYGWHILAPHCRGGGTALRIFCNMRCFQLWIHAIVRWNNAEKLQALCTP